MGVDYRKQYRPDQLEPFWPNEILKMSVAVLCTLGVIMVFAIHPVVLAELGLHDVVHQQEPADPKGGTPVGIKPEWYFLASYQFLKLMPTEWLGISGKTLGVVAQGVLVFVLALLPFWYRRRAHDRPNRKYRGGVTAVVVATIVLTIWGGWPAHHDEHGEHLIPLLEYVGHHPLLFVVLGAAIVVFVGLVAQERMTLRKFLAEPDGESRS
jgi:ubiquinol-cytochrome c reductase cytochrome b subunit